MPRFAINQPIETREPTIVVDPGLEPGPHRFQLEVLDAVGNRSRRAEAIVQVMSAAVAEPSAPTRVAGAVPADAAAPPFAAKVAKPHRESRVLKPRRGKKKE